MNLKTNILAAILALCGLGVSAHAYGACKSIPRTIPDSPVRTCESWFRYDIMIGDDSRSYDKSTFHKMARTLVADWLRAEELDPSALDGARLEYWLSVPEANPFAAQGRIQVTTESYPRLVFYVAPFPEEWGNPGRSDVGVLGDDYYPDSFGDQAGSYLLKSPGNHEEQALAVWLGGFGVELAEEFSPAWFQAEGPVLVEAETLRAMTKDPSFDEYLEKVQLNSFYEWVGHRERAFAFSLLSP